MKHWLMKTEPDGFSIDDLQRVGVEPWNGVRNYQARNFMRAMKKGDAVFIYHSNTEVPAIVGIAEVVAEAYPDPTQFNKKSPYFDAKSTQEQPRWDLVDVGFKRKLKQPITLETLKTNADSLEGLALIQRGTRLSVLPVSAAHWKTILSLE